MQRFILGSSVKQIVSYGVVTGGAVCGGVLAYRQHHLRQSPIIEAASAQLRSAAAVSALLGSPVASSGGMIGGYTDPVGGTAVLTIPIHSEGGVTAIARVEAEAEWVGARADARARGEPDPEPDKAEKCRWLLRHLEVSRDPAAEGGVPGSHEPPVVLYSLPAREPLSVWAPTRGPSRLPYWLRALIPEVPAAAREGDAIPRLLLVAGASIVLHAAVFLHLHRRMSKEKVIRHVETLLALPEAPNLHAMRDWVVQIARQAPGEKGAGAALELSNGAPLYGKVSREEVIGFNSLTGSRELFFRAERQRGSAGRASSSSMPARTARGSLGTTEQWVITYLSVQPTELWATRLSKLGVELSPEAYLAEMVATPTRPIDLGLVSRQIALPAQRGWTVE